MTPCGALDGGHTYGRVEASGAVFEAKFMLPWYFSEEAAAEKYMPQLQHNMWVIHSRSAVLSVITGGGKWVEVKTHADPLYQHLIVAAERKFGAVSRMGNCRACLAPSRRGRASKRSASSISNLPTSRGNPLGGLREALMSTVQYNEREDLDCAAQPQQTYNAEIARCFLRLANLDGGAFERLNRYEAALWRQVGQILLTLKFLHRGSYPRSRRSSMAFRPFPPGIAGLLPEAGDHER